MVKERDAPRDLLRELDDANNEWASALADHRQARRTLETAASEDLPVARDALERAQARIELAGARLAEVAGRLADRRRRG